MLDTPSSREAVGGRPASPGGAPSLLFVECLVEGDETLLEAEDGRPGAVGQPQLGQDAGHVRLDGLLADRTSRAAIRGSSTLSPWAGARTEATTWSTPAVLGRYASAPARTALSRCSSSVEEVSTSTSVAVHGDGTPGVKAQRHQVGLKLPHVPPVGHAKLKGPPRRPGPIPQRHRVAVHLIQRLPTAHQRAHGGQPSQDPTLGLAAPTAARRPAGTRRPARRLAGYGGWRDFLPAHDALRSGRVRQVGPPSPLDSSDAS